MDKQGKLSLICCTVTILTSWGHMYCVVELLIGIPSLLGTTPMAYIENPNFDTVQNTVLILCIYVYI